ncbi:ABC transporter permease [Listeria ivanovii]|uniref:ABC transporter permease n=1 Tax=Listeria ivanovii TaxID=1638 RepID=UPI0003EC9FE6|nr:ABC transporter permease [Listeria ivanovii]AHI55316.1 ABC transporter permease [Listeria ivanovii WSLC3009]AIS64775.1 ABC transporter permease [Listeria ivanovii subsp. ivanovii]MBC1758521.1 ABC transporter permease [Listeria ivanovii]MBK3913396.1 ABC transporter permease [Listeria ivanovii subsp. ivanovii]MBK3920486.1 ABC transporter permease [Listeria ivanovii subsp. ivanovii]
MFLALRELKHAKLRYILIVLIMVLIAWLVLFVTGLASGLANDNGAAISSNKATYYVLQKDSDNRLTRSNLTTSETQDVAKQVDNSKSTNLGVQMGTITKPKQDKKTDITYFGIDKTSFLQPEITEGTKPQTKKEIIADISLKEADYQLGSKLKDSATGEQFTITAFTKNNTFSHSPVIFVGWDAWELIHQTNQAAQGEYNAVALDVSQNKAESLSLGSLELSSSKEVLQGIPGYSEEQGSLLMMIAFLFVIAAFVLAAFFYVITIQKINQFGILKAVGARTAYLGRSIISQVVFLSVVSLLIGNGLTFGLAAILPASMPFTLSPLLAIGCSVLFLVVAVAGSLLSLYRVAKVDPLEAIGRAN